MPTVLDGGVIAAAAAGRISAASAAHGVGDYIAGLFANGGAQWEALVVDLKHVGVALTSAETATRESVTRTDRLAKTQIATAAT